MENSITAPVFAKANYSKQKTKVKVRYHAMPDTDLYEEEEEMAHPELNKYNKKIRK